jgi:TLD
MAGRKMSISLLVEYVSFTMVKAFAVTPFNLKQCTSLTNARKMPRCNVKQAISQVFFSTFGNSLEPSKKEETKLTHSVVGEEWADPVDSDTSEMAIIRPLLKNTALETQALRITYDANKQGWSASAFHHAVDNQGEGLVVCKTTSGLVVGGYNPKGWSGSDKYFRSTDAFVFVKQQEDTNHDQPFIKLRKVGGDGMHQRDIPERGPAFGDALIIQLRDDFNHDPKFVISELGKSCERFPDGTNSLFGNNVGSADLFDLKVYSGVYE